MQEADQFRGIFIHGDNIIREFNRMAGGKADAVDTVNRGHQADQFGKTADAAVKRRAAVSIHVLTQQVHFTHALSG